MATYQVSGPGGAVYQIDGPEGADPSALVQSISGNAQSPSPPGGALRQLALAGRDVGEGVFNTLMAPRDLGTKLVNAERSGVNRLLGTHLQPSPMYSQQLSDALTQSGAPVPTSAGEQLAASGIRGVSGALTGLGLLGPLGAATTAPNALRAGAAGLTGGVSSNVAQQAGAGPLGQFVAGLAGGVTPSALEGSLGLVGGLARPFTRAGQSQLAANTLQRAAINPAQAAANLDAAQTLIPGSMRTAGEASGDTGILSLEKGVRARNPGQFGERISQQNAARQAELGNLAGTQADITAAEKARDATTTPMREGAMSSGGTANVRPVLLKIDRILASPAGQREVPNAALTWLRDKLGAPGNVAGRFMTPSQLAKMGRGTFDARNPEELYAIRQDVNDAMNGRLGGDLSKFKLARSQLLDVRSALDDAIEQGAPGFKAYLARYRDMSEPIDQMEGMQELQQRASSGLDTSTGHPFLSAPKFTSGLRDLESGNARLTPNQTARLGALREDLQRGSALSSPTVRTPGSDTFQNFMTGGRLGGGLVGHVPVLGKYLRGVNDFVDQRVNEQLTRAMLDPGYAASLIRKGLPATTLKSVLKGAARNRALPIAMGPVAALPAPAQSPSLPVGLLSHFQ